MKMKSILRAIMLTLRHHMVLTGMISFGALVISRFYGPTSISNPFYIIACLFSLKLIILGVLYFSEPRPKTVELAEKLIYPTLEVVAAVLIVAFGMPTEQNLLVKLALTAMCGWFLYRGAQAAIFIGRAGWVKIQDSRAFNWRMKKVAESARVEQKLSADLANFLRTSHER
jgi:hypothetical protein